MTKFPSAWVREIPGELSGHLLRLIVGGIHDHTVRDGDDGLAKDGVALRFFAGTRVDAALTVELLPVDGHTLADPYISVDWKRGAGVARGVTAGVGRNVVAALQGRANHDDRLAVDSGSAASLGDLLMAGWCGAGTRGDTMGELLGNLRSGSDCNVEKEHGLRAFGERSGGFPLAGGLESHGDGRGVEGLQDDAIAQDLDLFDGDLAAREVRHGKFVDEVGTAVGAVKGHGRVGNAEQNGCHLFGCGVGCQDGSGQRGETDKGQGCECISTRGGHRGEGPSYPRASSAASTSSGPGQSV